jgi:hypothetical protein
VYTLVVVHDGFVVYGWRRVFDFCAPEYCTEKRSVSWYENNNASVWIIPALCLADKRPTLHRRGGCSEEIEGVGAGMAVTPCTMVSLVRIAVFRGCGFAHWMEISLSLIVDVWIEISRGI